MSVAAGFWCAMHDLFLRPQPRRPDHLHHLPSGAAGPVMCAVFFTALKLFEGNPAGILPFLQASRVPALLHRCMRARWHLHSSTDRPVCCPACRRSGCPRCAPAWQVRWTSAFVVKAFGQLLVWFACNCQPGPAMECTSTCCINELHFLLIPRCSVGALQPGELPLHP